MGRNALPEEQRKPKMMVSIDEDLRDWVRSIAASTGISQSRLLGSAVKQLKDRYEASGNDVNELVDRG